MKMISLSFTGENVLAILDGRKTMTRRVTVPQPVPYAPNYPGASEEDLAHAGEPWMPIGGCRRDLWKCRYGGIGDRIWVREAYRLDRQYDALRPEAVKFSRVHRIHFEADGPAPEWAGRYRNSRHMMKVCSRITLEITGFRAERLQEITEDDANAEGIACSDCWTKGTPYRDFPHADYCGCRNKFANLWDSITVNGLHHPWASNPWVWVIGFKQVEDL